MVPEHIPVIFQAIHHHSLVVVQRLYSKELRGNEPVGKSLSASQCGVVGHLARDSKKDSGTCFRFNSSIGCKTSSCTLAHVCSVCKGGHSRVGCSCGSGP